MRVCYAASAKTESKGKRYQRQAQSVAEADDDTLRRAIWTTAYWIQNEFTCQCVTVHTGGRATGLQKKRGKCR